MSDKMSYHKILSDRHRLNIIGLIYDRQRSERLCFLGKSPQYLYLDYFVHFHKHLGSTIAKSLVRFQNDHIDGLAQDCSNSIGNALELLHSCIKPSILF